MLNIEDTLELLRGVPVLCCFASIVLLSSHVSPAGAVHGFTAYRMQHFDLHGTHYGMSCDGCSLDVIKVILEAGLYRRQPEHGDCRAVYSNYCPCGLSV